MHSSLDLIFKEAKIRLWWTFLCLFLTCGFCYWFSEYLLFILTSPFLKISKPSSIFICTQLTESLTTYITTSFLLCLFFCTPYIIYQLWCFFIPSCNQKQRAQVLQLAILSVIAFSLFFFLTFFWIMPNIWFFLYNLSSFTASENLLIIKLQPKIYDFILLTLRFFLITSICSQVPVLLIFCIEYNYISLLHCFKHRKTFFFLSVILAALITPPDIWCQLATSIPLYFFIEFTFLVALIRKKYKEKIDQTIVKESI